MQRTQVDSSAPSSMRSGRVSLEWRQQRSRLRKRSHRRRDDRAQTFAFAGGMVFAMQITRSGNLAQGGSTKPIENLQYLHTDHLGSVAVVTDDTGSVTERLAYDPWGKRRFPNGTADTNDSIIGLTLDRGFTMHEHLDEMGLIHMNGRIFDPLIGRFMSADPFIQAPENLQSHNRFAYVMNNPLNLTDPSGFKWYKKKWFRAVAAIAVGYFTGGLVSGLLQSGAGLSGSAFFSVATSSAAGAIAPGLTALGSAVAGAAGGFAAGLVGSGGDLKAGLLGALSGGAFGFVGGTYAAGSFGNYAGHAITGCITSVAGGGQCGSGAASALFGKFTTNHVQFENTALHFAATSVAGGVGSVIGGGKFENGAVTAAYGYLFNQLTTTQKPIDIGKSGSRIDKIKEFFNYQENYDSGLAAGSEFKQKQADDLATMQARIEKNPDAQTTQESANVYKRASTYASLPGIAWDAAGDRNIVKAYPFVRGFYKGYADCVCKGIPRE